MEEINEKNIFTIFIYIILVIDVIRNPRYQKFCVLRKFPHVDFASDSSLFVFARVKFKEGLKS